MTIRTESELKRIADDIWVYRDDHQEAIIKIMSLTNDIIDTLYEELENLEITPSDSDDALLLGFMGVMA